MNHLMTMLDQNARLHIGFGSDFWGADRMIEGINGPNDWSRFLEMAKSEQLLSENDWIRIGSENWLTFFRKMMK
jgi:microsomal dipeptidase-like Zn-dependent dipeptidase